MKSFLKRITAFITTLTMMFTMMPATTLAEGTIGPFGDPDTYTISFRFVDDTGKDYLGITKDAEITSLTYKAGEKVKADDLINHMNWADIKNKQFISSLGAYAGDCYDVNSISGSTSTCQ